MTTLIVPGWGNSGPDHWQSLWEAAGPDRVRVRQDDWDRPDPDRWVAALDKAVAACPEPPVIVAHSLGCTTVVHWAARTPAASVRAALLVAPPDVDRADQPELFGFRPVPRAPLPFPALVVGSRNDPWMTGERASEFAAAWGCGFTDAGEAGHLNPDAGYGPWPEGERLLAALLARTP
ncbi:RBBP9/YdeN family alpha/beta hydrolase [Streptomyces sp. NPDC058701]|uniref:RBBP9/YdeN family alpha/beta hydrolase n=1 Tax=Streptomyces sp. NPDC058701 TaxID=3346608 RepID=UPI0036574B94